jgi:hypothetical protein
MDYDPNSLDPELRTARQLAIASAALGVMSLCLAIIPACGGITSILGVICGTLSLRTEHTRTAYAGVVLSIFGVVITIVYAAFLYIARR